MVKTYEGSLSRRFPLGCCYQIAVVNQIPREGAAGRPLFAVRWVKSSLEVEEEGGQNRRTAGRGERAREPSQLRCS